MTTNIATRSTRSVLDRAGIQGQTITIGESGWDAARQAWNLAVDQRPLAVVFPDSTADVIATVRAAQELGARIVTQGTGHGATAYTTLDDSILVRTIGLRDISISGRTCRVGSGALWGDVAAAAAKGGLAGLGGSSPDVGVVGYTLGGGIGWLSRRYGLASNAVTAIELVTADGRLRRIDTFEEPEAFWALRGGGGGLGIVTALEFDLFPIRTVIAGTLAWDAAHSARLLDAWASWTSGLDHSITSIIRFLSLPDVPGIPEPFAGKRVMTLGVTATPDYPHAQDRIEEMRGLAPTVLDTIAPVSPSTLCRLHGDPEGPTAGMSHHTLVARMDSTMVEALVDVAGPDSGSGLISMEVRHLGGALARIPVGAGALSHIAAPYVVNAVAAAFDADMAAASYSELGRTIDAIAPWSAGTYMNFMERPGPSPFDPVTTARLTAVKNEFDPAGMFRSRDITTGTAWS